MVNHEEPAGSKQKNADEEDQDDSPMGIIEDSDGYAPLAIEEDEDEEGGLCIAEGEEEEEVVVVATKKKKSKKKKSEDELKRAHEAEQARKAAIVAQMAGMTCETAEDRDKYIALTDQLHFPNKKMKHRKIKSEAQIKKEIDMEMNPRDWSAAIARVFADEKKVFSDWQQKLKNELPDSEDDDNSDDEESTKVLEAMKGMGREVRKNTKKERMALEDMPDIENLMDNSTPQMVGNERRMAESGEDEEEEEKNTKKEKKGGKKKGPAGGARRKKKDETHGQTHEEVMADIGRKKAVAEEKATRMKEQRREGMERRREKKEEEEREREERKMKKQEMEAAKKKKARTPVVRKPKSRAEAARRTKQLMAIPKRGRLAGNESGGEEEDGETPRKKRRYNRRSSAVHPPGYYQQAEGTEDDDEASGKYTYNPCEMEMEDVCPADPLADSSSDEDDNVLSVPLWTSPNDQLPDGAIGPRNFDADEQMKRYVNDVETKFTTGLSKEYRDMTNLMDKMKLNLFGDAMYRRFNPKVIHDVADMETQGSWPADRVHRAGDDRIPKYKSQIWKFDASRPFKGLVRVRPVHKQKDVITSHDIDVMSGCAGVVPVVTREDIVKSVDDLIRSKMNGTKYTPLPSNRNPWDVPEVATRTPVIKEMTVEEEYEKTPVLRSGGYIKKVAVQNLPMQTPMKKRKMTRKQLLKEEMEQKNGKKHNGEERLSIYKNEEPVAHEEEEEGYQYGWNEEEELYDNPMRDDHMEDPFATMGYQGMEYHDEGEDAMGERAVLYEEDMMEDEAGLGEAFSFLANHLV